MCQTTYFLCPNCEATRVLDLDRIEEDAEIACMACRHEFKIKLAPPSECRWTENSNDESDYWDTACGEAFCFITGGPEENKMRYCPYCGGHLIRIVVEPSPKQRIANK